MSQSLQTRPALQLLPAEEPGKAELKEQFIELRAKGLSYAKIARRMKLSRNTLASWSQELEAEIASLKAMELESLQEQYFLLKEGRIKLLGETLKGLQEELKKRDLAGVSTDKLLDMWLKVYQELKEEAIEVRPLSESEIAELKALR
jgi:transcriptional regulator with XRE-family HTH domain